MAKKKKEQEPIEKFREKWTLPRDFPKEQLDLLNERYEAIEKWEEKERKKGGSFNEQFCADLYVIADITSKDNSFKGKFSPGDLYCEMDETVKEFLKKRTDYTIFDEAKAIETIIEKHKKK